MLASASRQVPYFQLVSLKVQNLRALGTMGCKFLDLIDYLEIGNRFFKISQNLRVKSKLEIFSKQIIFL